MLSRVADSLYWMSRYLERAEHTSRLLDVNLNLMLDKCGTSAERRWQRMLAALGKSRGRASGRAIPTQLVHLAVLRHGETRLRSSRASSRRAKMRVTCAKRSPPSSGTG